MMKKLNLSQNWVTKVTSDVMAEDIFLSGRDVGGAPSEEELAAIVNSAARSDAVREMVRRKWFKVPSDGNAQMHRGKALYDFLFLQKAHRSIVAATAMFHRQLRQRDLVDEMATFAWMCKVADKATKSKSRVSFNCDNLNSRTISHVVRLSTQASGPRAAIEYLQSKLGITVVLESSLPGMRTDGVSFVVQEVGPIIGLTLRHDRLDNFWFTLLHEIGHIALHLSNNSKDVYVDSIEDGDSDDLESEAEAEANAFAKDAFVPRDAWLRSDAFRFGTEAAVKELAEKCSIHPAIVAGRLRFEKRKYHALPHLLGVGSVRSELLAE